MEVEPLHREYLQRHRRTYQLVGRLENKAAAARTALNVNEIAWSPKGSPKSGGRKKGTPNRSTVQTRDRIRELADPIKFMSDVMAGAVLNLEMLSDGNRGV